MVDATEAAKTLASTVVVQLVDEAEEAFSSALVAEEALSSALVLQHVP
jgi:hypothetical protein